MEELSSKGDKLIFIIYQEGDEILNKFVCSFFDKTFYIKCSQKMFDSDPEPEKMFTNWSRSVFVNELCQRQSRNFHRYFLLDSSIGPSK